MAKDQKTFKHGIRLPDIQDGFACTTEPCLAVCTCVENEGRTYVYAGKLKSYLEGAIREVVTTTQAQTLTNKTISGGRTVSPLLLSDNASPCPTEVNITLNPCQAIGTICITLPQTADTLVGRATIDILLNKTLTAPAINDADICLGTASNTKKITVSKDTFANLCSLARKEGTFYFATDTKMTYFDDGTSLVLLEPGCVTDFLDLTDTPFAYTCDALKFVRVNACENGLEFASVSTAATSETTVVTTEGELDTALTNAAACSADCRDIIIGASFSITGQKEIPSNTSIRQNTNAFVITGVGACFTLGVREVSTVTMALCACIPAGLDGESILINAPRFGTDQQYFMFFDDSACQCLAVPCETGTGVRIDTNGDTTNNNLAASMKTSLDANVCFSPCFAVCVTCAVVTITANRTGVVTDIVVGVTGPPACDITLATSTQGVDAPSMFNFAACVSKGKLEGVNLTTTSNALTGVSIQNTASKNRILNISVTTGSAPTTPMVTIDGQKNIITENEIDTCSACVGFGKIELGTNSSGNAVSDNVVD